ncbi:MAG: 30S ribosomal protein S15 [Mycoplasmataceae bacterium]|jgi:small subunit ribosomal protein S15|nr:30S ribosomal protein S15 [Mycoplasmataceae bacterium]
MAISKAFKQQLVKEFGGSDKNTGSIEVQIAILTAEINAITTHVSTNKKDFSTKRGLFKKVSQRRSLLNYLERTDIEKYRALVKKLEIRK